MNVYLEWVRYAASYMRRVGDTRRGDYGMHCRVILCVGGRCASVNDIRLVEIEQRTGTRVYRAVAAGWGMLFKALSHIFITCSTQRVCWPLGAVPKIQYNIFEEITRRYVQNEHRSDLRPSAC